MLTSLPPAAAAAATAVDIGSFGRHAFGVELLFLSTTWWPTWWPTWCLLVEIVLGRRESWGWLRIVWGWLTVLLIVHGGNRWLVNWLLVELCLLLAIA